MYYLTTAAIALILNLIFIPLILKLARSKGWYDGTGGRKIHTGSVPRLGGVGIAWSFAISLFISLAFLTVLRDRIITPWVSLALVLGGFLTVHIVGLIDDFKPLRARFKLGFQVLVALGILLAGYRFKSLYLPFNIGFVDLGLFSYILTFFWILGMMNAINLIDGMDGLSGGIAIIVFSTYTFLAFKNNDLTAGTVSAALVGAVLGFLFYNFPPASIFMGDSGSLFLGTAFALMPLLLEEPGRLGNGFFPAVTLSLVPILDTLWAMVRRQRRGISFMTPDRGHLHHKLLDLGLDVRQALGVVYGFCLILVAGVVAGVYVDRDLGFIILAGASLAVLVGFGVIRLLCFGRVCSPHSGAK
jgi:UDP-GlcNAc:undecaprenyl-phosphate GlcNAc-1-phosphate transferase